MLIGLYGGTFDPVHLGHLHAAIAVQKSLGFPTVRMVLAARPGHRGQPSTDIYHRWRMLCLACESYPELEPDDAEIARQGASYTLETLAAWCEANPGTVPCWILGEDAFVTLPLWHRWESLLDYCNLVVVRRPGLSSRYSETLTRFCDEYEVRQLNRFSSGQIYRCALPMENISATQVRSAIAMGNRWVICLPSPSAPILSNTSFMVLRRTLLDRKKTA